MKKSLYVLCSMLMIVVPSVQASSSISFQASDISNATFRITESGSYEFVNNMAYQYNPISVSSSRPAVKITASDVVLDFNNIGLYNNDTSEAGWVGVEIGWSPEELAADSSRVQPKNIVIRELSLYNFDAGMIIHAGVQSVKVQKCKFYDTAIGVAILGTATKNCHDIYMRNVTIFGYDDDYHTALENIKTYIETTCGYGANYWMPMKTDPHNSNSADVYTYYGVWANYLNKGYFCQFEIQDIGYSDYATTSEGNGYRTEGVGCCIKNSRRIDFADSSITQIASEIKAVCLQLDNVQEIEVKDSTFSYCASKIKSVGIEVLNSLSLPFSVEAIKLTSVVTRSHIADEVAIGIDVSAVRGLHGTNLTSKYNKGGKQAYGMYTNKLYTGNIQESTLSENTATRLVNDVATEQGIVAAGFYGENVNSFQARKLDVCSEQALNSAYGVYLKNSSSCQFADSQFVANVTTSMRSGEAAAIRTAQDGQEISKHGPVVTAASTGAYGAYVIGSRYVKFENCTANSNTGHRAIGFYFSGCRAVALWNSMASTQFATGQMFDSTLSTDNISNPNAISISAYHRPLLFGDLTKSTVDAVAATDLFLQKLATIRAAQIAGTEPAYADVKALIATSSLMQALCARYRLWSVAFGVQAHNVTGFLLKDCVCTGQVSMFDSGVGMCFTGRNTGHAVEKCNLSFNVGGLSSVQTAQTNPSAQYAYYYNLIGQKLLWDMLLAGKQPWTLQTSLSVGTTVRCSAFSPDNTLLAVGTDNNEVKIYNTSTWATVATLTGHSANITALAWKPDGTRLASAASSSTSNIKIWNTSSWAIDETLTHVSSGVYALAWKPDGSRLASGAAALLNNLVIWNSSTWTASSSLLHGLTKVQALAWNTDGSRLVSGSVDSSNNMLVWNSTTWTVTNTLSSHSSGVTSLSFNADSTLLASGSADQTVKIWDSSNWSVSQTLSPSSGSISDVKFKPDGRLLAAACGSNVVKVWKTSSWASVDTTLSDFTDSVLTVSWSQYGRRLAAAGSDGTVRVYFTNLYKVASSGLEVGLNTASSGYIAQNSLAFSNTMDGNSTFIDIKAGPRWLVSPVGPVGAGLIMGDLMLEGMVKSTYMYGNLGNAGHAYGVLMDKAFSVTLDSNHIAGNISNTHGMTVGILDVTAHSPNLYMKNFLEGNKCSIFNNGNYFIPFNPADSNTLAFPVKKIMNGKFADVTTEYDNTIVEYSQAAEFYPYDYLATLPVHPDLRSFLTSNSCWA